MQGIINKLRIYRASRVCVWQGFCYYEPGWSPIRELVAVELLTLSHIV